ncbi:Glyoxalase superfamily enzyme, possibly 3-demethylubiquinone-9 3-methyltransferase [Lishizhenia tianjinensis]|uniref:Glyoxalase superfamily enzyme, possibly 3-demethylubiquinone-9 3-methyltransferase n=1 Tax=Lishizhenia tianjinensis TaxID=477690 RepID=A0A1I7AEH8_9FLAO|nr:VOC family protein [Lishizhenia tianjinensis]SFT73240.1 Glyoxalase superfamily enzyme, possibly 3-demethylubiquinone-9 3-methyltransferase [Lishizhenia tianjinensis]
MKKHISTCIWLDNSASEAASFYAQVLHNVQILSESPFLTGIDIDGTRVTLMNGGPSYRPSPAVSFYYLIEEEKDFNQVYTALMQEGKVYLPLDQYPWAEKYAWVEDKFGVSWQLALGEISLVNQRVSPFLTFTGANFGRGEEALSLYAELFSDYQSGGVLKYPEAMGADYSGKIQHTQFSINGTVLMLSENPQQHTWQFTEGNSFMLLCDSQEEIDSFWSKLSEGGEEGRCGWLKDKFGISWQIIPSVLGSLMQDQSRIEAVSKAFMAMKKIDIETLTLAGVEV